VRKENTKNTSYILKSGHDYFWKFKGRVRDKGVAKEEFHEL